MHSEVDSPFGPLIIGLVVACVISGITIAQIMTFARNCESDSVGLKIMVGFLWILDILHMIFTVHWVYHYLVSNPTDLSMVWSIPACVLILGIIVPTGQGLYVVRIWKIVAPSQRYIPITLAFLVFANTATGIHVVVKIFQCDDILALLAIPSKPGIILWLVMSAIINPLITIFLVYTLSKAGTNLRWTNSSYTVLLAYLLNTGAVLSVISLANFVVFLTSDDILVLLAIETVSIRLQANNVLGMINARHYFQSQRPPTALKLKSETSSQYNSADETQRRVSKTINEVGLPLFQSPTKPEEIKMVEIMVQQEAHTDSLKL